MAIVRKYARSVQDPNSASRVAQVFAEGADRTINTNAIAIANGDNATSRIYLGKIRSDAIPDLRSQLYHDAITGLTSASIGVEYNGATISANVFANALNLAAAAGAKNVFAAITTANIGKRVFELLGLTVDPAREYDIVLTMDTDATAAGNISAQIAYAK